MDTSIDKVAQGNSEFSWEFYKVVAQVEQGNIVFSPMSCLIALAMVHAGAKGESIQKIAQGLRLPENITEALEGLSEVISLLRSAPKEEQSVANVDQDFLASEERYYFAARRRQFKYQSGSKLELSVANKIYVEQNFPILEEYSAALEKYFKVEAENVVFTEPSTVDKINDWVSNQTKDKIKNLVDSNSFDSLTRLVLVNAIYFRGQWLEPFEKINTRNEPFFTDKTISVNVPFMYQNSYFMYRELYELDAQLLVLPYKGINLSMAIILPNKKDGLKELEEKLATVNLGELLQSGNSQRVDVYLPKFKIETTLNFVDHLSRMGLSHIFSDEVNLKGISTAEYLKVSDVVQKAFIEVSEEGTETLAATISAVTMRFDVSARGSPVMKCDHPFVYFLNLNLTHVVFGGRVANPDI